MPFCQNCGSQVEQLPVIAPAAEAVSAEVEIARINAERDVKVAQINARQEKEWNETHVEIAGIEAEAEVASAEATAEVIGEVLAADSEPAEEPEPDPVVVADVPEPEPDLSPPVAGQHESSPPKSPGWGFS